MGRPPEVTDEEIIAAGRKLDAVGGVNATRLWKACGEHGKPARLLEVWSGYRQGQSSEPVATAGAPLRLPIPEAAQRLATGLKGELSIGIDRALASIYAAVEHVVQGRFRQELADLTSVREAHRAEIEDALTALGDMSEAGDDREVRIGDLEAALASVLRERDVSEALRAAQTAQHETALARLRDAETNLQQERQTSVELKIAQARGEVERESLDHQCRSIRAKLEIARTATEQHKLDLASVRESDGRNLEAVRQRDLEIERLREVTTKIETANLALMERAIAAEQIGRDVLTTVAPGTTVPAAAVPRRRDRTPRRPDTDTFAPEALVSQHTTPDAMATQPRSDTVSPEPSLDSMGGNVR